ncbi:MAG: HD domain-containing phosphohydrolase, partial [candidate division NC10 bacterium]
MNPKVLLVDDEASVLSALQRLLRKESLEVVPCTAPEEALRMVETGGYAVVLSDQRMPGMDGPHFLEKVREISPDTVRILLTGHADVEAATEAINRGAVYRFLTKPWDDAQLCQVMREAVAQFQLVSENKRLQTLTSRQNLELKDLNQNLENKVQERTKEISGLHQRMEQSFLATVRVLAELAELHSTVIGSHAKRVAALPKDVAERMDISGKELFLMEIAATLHDVGKVALPPEILNKPEASLSRTETEALRRHAAQGEMIVAMVPDMAEAAKIIRHHHEQFDGGGYPDRLKRQAIPLGSRVIAAVDAYDKALNARAHFESATPEKALQFVRSKCPEKFDPDVVAAIAECLGDSQLAWGEGTEVEVRPKDLQAGMVLSREMRTARGLLLLPKDSALTQEHLARIQNYQTSDPVAGNIYVYRKVPKGEAT